MRSGGNYVSTMSVVFVVVPMSAGRVSPLHTSLQQRRHHMTARGLKLSSCNMMRPVSFFSVDIQCDAYLAVYRLHLIFHWLGLRYNTYVGSIDCKKFQQIFWFYFNAINPAVLSTTPVYGCKWLYLIMRQKLQRPSTIWKQLCKSTIRYDTMYLNVQ